MLRSRSAFCNCRYRLFTFRSNPPPNPITRHHFTTKPSSLSQQPSKTSTSASTSTSSSSSSSPSRHYNRLNRILSCLPTRLQRYTNSLRAAPVTHVFAFLLLHEITAVVPLVGLAATFHYTNWLPPGMSEGKWVADGMEMFGRWFRRRGWFGTTGEAAAAATELSRQETTRFDLDGDDGRVKVTAPVAATAAAAPVRTKREKWWGRSEVGVRVIAETATAWAIVKALLPLRLVLSVWGTPWFARAVVIPTSSWFRRKVPFTSLKKG